MTDPQNATTTVPSSSSSSSSSKFMSLGSSITIPLSRIMVPRLVVSSRCNSMTMPSGRGCGLGSPPANARGGMTDNKLGEASDPRRDPCAEKRDPRRDQRISSSMLPRPESEGEGVPEEVDPHGQAPPPLGGGDLQSSLLTFRSAMVEAATREAERVDTAIHTLRNKSASG